MPMKTKSAGSKLKEKATSKAKYANAQLAAAAKIMPDSEAKLPKKKYSNKLIIKTCFRLAPNVLSDQ